MIAWINELSDMPDWHQKMFDPDFIFQWKSAKLLAGGTRSMADWVCQYHPAVPALLTICT